MPIVRALPRAITPNQVTLTGHACLWTCAIVALAVPHRTTLALLALAFGFTAYNVADTIDGMYARHSGRTSRIGELLDHGLAALGMPLVPLTYGIVLGLPAWLVLASTATIAYLQFLTFLHGYRIGHVILGEVGVIEGLGLAAGVCLAAALGGWEALTPPSMYGVSWAGLLAIAFIASALPAFVSMRRLARYPGDLIPLAVLMTAILAWFAFGAIGVRAAGLLLVFASAYEMMLVTSARLRRLPLALRDSGFTAALAVIVVASIALEASGPLQTALASALALYAGFRFAVLFFQTVAAVESRR